MANQTTSEQTGQRQSRRRRNWSITGALGVAASIATILTFINSNNGTSSQAGNVSSPITSTPATSASTVTTSQGDIPSLDLGTWGGFLQGNGESERVIINLSQGKAASEVGSFSNQTFNCQGAIFLNGDTTVTMNGTSVPAVDLDLETTQNPADACVSSAEAIAASSDGSTLVFEIVTAGTTQGTLQNPLVEGNLTH